MWSLKYEFRHRECKYLPQADKLNVRLLSYTINNYVKDGPVYVSAIHILEGELKNVKKYINYLKKISLKIEKISSNIVFTLTKMDRNLEYYKALYNQFLFFPTPILHTGNKEFAEIMSWEREHLTRLLNVLSKGKNTDYFKLLSFKQKKLKNIFLMKITQKITEKQRDIFEYALKKGYYNYPRKINLQKIAEHFKLRKSTCHEILRRAEKNILGKIA